MSLRQVIPGHGVVGTLKGKNDSVNGQEKKKMRKMAKLLNLCPVSEQQEYNGLLLCVLLPKRGSVLLRIRP